MQYSDLIDDKSKNFSYAMGRLIEYVLFLTLALIQNISG